MLSVRGLPEYLACLRRVTGHGIHTPSCPLAAEELRRRLGHQGPSDRTLTRGTEAVMDCCSGGLRYPDAERQFGAEVATRDLTRYRRKGPDAVSRLFLTSLGDH